MRWPDVSRRYIRPRRRNGEPPEAAQFVGVADAPAVGIAVDEAVAGAHTPDARYAVAEMQLQSASAKSMTIVNASLVASCFNEDGCARPRDAH
jgi:hypothetical protein